MDQRPVRWVGEDERAPFDRSVWPATLPPVRQLLDDGLELGGLTVLVGENGSGKSTILEALAMAYGMAPEGGSTGAQHATRASESPLHASLHLTRGGGAARWGYFVRAETMHGLFSYLEDHPGREDPRFHEMSHGESFQAVMDSRRFATDGLFVLDEPEAGLAFLAQLKLVAQLAELGGRPRTQVVVATHSPIIAAVPGAELLQLDGNGLTRVAWEELAVVAHYRNFLDGPQRYLRHLI